MNSPQTVGENAGTLFQRCSQVFERDDGKWSIGFHDDAAGPFESRAFALRVAIGVEPAPAAVAKFRRIREVRRASP
jgi:hypothetical protein